MKHLIDKFIRDKSGTIVLWQPPSLPIFGWFVFMILAFFMPPGGSLHAGFMSLGTAFLFVWSYLEITDGVTYFRKLLGVVVMFVVLSSYFTR